MDPELDIEELSSFMQTYKPFSVSDVNPSKSSIAHDMPSSEILPCTLNSISLLEISEERDEEVNDQARLEETVEMKLDDDIHLSSPKRSARLIKTNQKNASKKVGRGCRKQVVINEMLDSILSSVERKSRSNGFRPARPSVWGSVDVLRYFEKIPGTGIKEGSTKSKKARAVRGSRREKHNGIVMGLEASLQNTSPASGRIRFKDKLGKEMGKICSKDVISVAGKGPQIFVATGTDSHKIPNFSGHYTNEGVLAASGAGERLDGFVTDNHQGIPSPVEIEGLRVGVDNKYLDLGTSPDSEVINQIPESQINGKEREEFHDVQISKQTCVAPSDIVNLDVPLESRKNSKKSKNRPSAHDLKVQGRRGMLGESSVAERCGQGEKLGDGLDFSGASTLTNIVNLSSNPSSCKGYPWDLSLSSNASGRGNLFPCMKKIEGRNHLNISTPKQGSKVGSEVLESPSNQKGNPCRTKGNSAKSIGKKKVKDKTACGEFARTIKDYHETGYNSLDVLEIAKTGDGNLAQGKSEVGTAHIDVPDLCIPPRNAWVCCDECFKWRRIPATLADAINDTNSRWTCKENVDKDFADCLIPQEKSNSEINAELDISDASGDENLCLGGFCPKQSHPNPAGGLEQSSWRLIKSNMFMHRSRKSQTIDEIMVCHCKAPTNGRLGCGDGCLNRMLNIECVKGTCPCGERCSNQQFQKRKYAKLKWFRCGKKGFGLQLLEDISEGQFLIEYVGEVLDMQAYEARQRNYASQGHKHFYFMTLNGGEVIDACAKGNLGRFINHSCDPNCRTEKWMVNGEVCVGLFALKDLKKGDEVTFDYNYVRVFGAAAKKCVCGSSHCRGYIGGDPRNTDTIVLGDSDDEFPEPVMVCEDGEADDGLKDLISTIPIDAAKASVGNAEQVLICEDKRERAETRVQHLEGTKELRLEDVLVNVDHKTDDMTNDVHLLEELCGDAGNEKPPISLEVMGKSAEALLPAIQKLKSPGQQDVDSVSTISDPRQVNISSPEASPLTVVKNKSLKNTNDTKKKQKSEKLVDSSAPKLSKVMKTPRSSASAKKGKSSISYSVNLNKLEKIADRSHGFSDKPKKVTEDSTTVEGTLNELLDDEGGISKRQDATKGYLKLLLLTAASGDSSSGEAIQSNRELSMILGAILKTKSRSVLVDVINKNGLQMLHNMLKRCRKDFSGIPILRKLLRVLEFLATKEILTKDLINKDPPCAGVESFRESILSLAEHDDKQVHRIARTFRDKWIPWHLRRRFPSHNHWQDSQTRDTVDDNKQTLPTTVSDSVDTVTKESCSTQSRKRKSRWDQPGDTNKEPKLQSDVNYMNAVGEEEHLETRADDGGVDMDEDVPPGFAPPCSKVSSTDKEIDFPCKVSSANKESDLPGKVEIGYPQGKFLNRSAVSYGVPMPIVHQLGYPETDSLENWCIAPGIPFQPYPPLPTYPRSRSDMRDNRGNCQPAMSKSDHNPPSISGSLPYDAQYQGTNNRGNFQRGRGSHGMGRYFRQQKWNNPRLPPPWNRKRNGWGFMGNDSRNRMWGGGNGFQGGNNMEVDPQYFTQMPEQGAYY